MNYRNWLVASNPKKRLKKRLFLATFLVTLKEHKIFSKLSPIAVSQIKVL
jgi:hypothetical protein